MTLPKPPNLKVSYCNIPGAPHTRSMTSLPEATPFPVSPLRCSLKQIWVNIVDTAVNPSSMFSVIWYLWFRQWRFVSIFTGHLSHFTSVSCVKSNEHCTKMLALPCYGKFLIVSEWNHIPFLIFPQFPFICSGTYFLDAITVPVIVSMLSSSRANWRCPVPGAVNTSGRLAGAAFDESSTPLFHCSCNSHTSSRIYRISLQSNSYT
jgi:hypothetical protein